MTKLELRTEARFLVADYLATRRVTACPAGRHAAECSYNGRLTARMASASVADCSAKQAFNRARFGGVQFRRHGRTAA